MHSLINKVFICIFSLMVSLQLPLAAQQVDRVVYSSAGRHVLKNNFSLNYNIGEPVVFTATGSNVILTQGFEQPDQALVTGISSVHPEMEAVVFPNPVSDQLHIHITNTTQGADLKLEVFDLVGKKISPPYQYSPAETMVKVGSSSLLNSTFSVDLSACKAGIYFITVSSVRNALNETFKIIKE
jgi:hypothetical protein